MKNQWTLIAALLFGICIAIFSIVNVRRVPVDFVFTMVQAPLVLVILGSALLGALVSGSIALFRRFGYVRHIKELQLIIEEKEELLRQEQLRIIPQEQVVVRDVESVEDEVTEAEIVPYDKM